MDAPVIPEQSEDISIDILSIETPETKRKYSYEHAILRRKRITLDITTFFIMMFICRFVSMAVSNTFKFGQIFFSIFHIAS